MKQGGGHSGAAGAIYLSVTGTNRLPRQIGLAAPVVPSFPAAVPEANSVPGPTLEWRVGTADTEPPERPFCALCPDITPLRRAS